MHPSLSVREHLIKALHTDLIGPFEEDEILGTPPSRWYLTGFLIPEKAPAAQRCDIESNEDLGVGVEGGEEGLAQPESPSQKVFFPSSIGMSFLIPKNTKNIEVEVFWSLYRRLSQDESNILREHELKTDREMKKTHAMTPEIIPEEEGENEAKDRKDSFGRYWKRFPREKQKIIFPVGSYDKLHIPKYGSIGYEDVYFVQKVEPHPNSLNESLVVSLFLVNGGMPGETNSVADESFIFQVGFSVGSQEGFLPRTIKMNPTSIDDCRNDLQYRNRNDWATGHNISTFAHIDEDDNVYKLETTWMPTADVYRMKATSIEGVQLSMIHLFSMRDPSMLDEAMLPMFKAYSAWIKVNRERIKTLSSEIRKKTATDLMEAAELAISRMKKGIHVLKENVDAWKSFRWMNKAMGLAAQKARPDVENPSWRLFQLAFILLNIEGMTNYSAADRKKIDLLFFPTGGGKTEAYLGVASYCMFLRRLRYRNENHQGAGVAVILRYTLRLLTIDQLERAATLVCAMELLRENELRRELGERRFSVGLWVGKSATPITLSDAHTEVQKYKNNTYKEVPYPLSKCPWCQTPFERAGFSLPKTQERGGKRYALYVRCLSKKQEPTGDMHADFDPFSEEISSETYDRCPFSKTEGVPVVTVDEHLYNELPSLIIGTVDKFALLPWRGQVGMLFGKVSGCDKYRFYPPHEEGRDGFRRIHGGLPSPELIIQDELHLITGPLGTMVGLYETAFDALASSTHTTKIIASTATAKRAQSQLQALYGRSDYALFPPQGIDDGDTFFATTEEVESKSRRYLGIAAPGRSMRLITGQVYTCLLTAAYKAYMNLKTPDTTNPADPFMTLVGYFNSLRDLGGMQRIYQESVHLRCSRMNVRRSANTKSNKFFRNRPLSYEPLELTSRVSASTITKTKDKLSEPYSKDNRNDVLLASSMISVGVDISRLGLMVMAGQPRTVAEYIQSTSRVGRSTPGLVITVYNLFKPRDRSYYERFSYFHSSFYRFIESASVTPFSGRALERGLSGLTIGLVRHYINRMSDNSNASQIKNAKNQIQSIKNLIQERANAHREVEASFGDRVVLEVQNRLDVWAEIAEEMSGHGNHMIYSPWEGNAALAILRDSVTKVNHHYPKLSKFTSPTSMRDVEPSVHFWVGFLK